MTYPLHVSPQPPLRSNHSQTTEDFSVQHTQSPVLQQSSIVRIFYNTELSRHGGITTY